MRFYASLLCILFLGCQGVDSSDPPDLSADDEGLFDPPVEASVALWGFDSHLPDEAAVKILRFTPEVTELPLRFAVETPDAPHTLIHQTPGHAVTAANARYYFTGSIDLQQDGKICLGDYEQDFDRSPYYEYDAVPQHLTFHFVRILEERPCRTPD